MDFGHYWAMNTQSLPLGNGIRYGRRFCSVLSCREVVRVDYSDNIKFRVGVAREGVWRDRVSFHSGLEP